MRRRTGRRPGKQDTRAAILAAAREAFAERGYDDTSIRQIATSAGVDPALVHHYFGTKEQLFIATVQPPVDAAKVFSSLFAGDLDTLAERLLTTFMSIWEHPVSGPAFEALLRNALTNRVSARLIREFFTVQIQRRAVERLPTSDPAEARLRATLVASQLFGLAVIRYVLRFQPLASVPRESVIALVGPTIQHYLTGELKEPPATDLAPHH